MGGGQHGVGCVPGSVRWVAVPWCVRAWCGGGLQHSVCIHASIMQSMHTCTYMYLLHACIYIISICICVHIHTTYMYTVQYSMCVCHSASLLPRGHMT